MICDRCLKPLDPDVAHWDHKDDCALGAGDEPTCDCDLSTCPGCCRSCIPMPAHKNARAV